MGRGFTQYSYINSDLPDEWPLHSAFLDYLLEDGTRLHVNQNDYYCTVCDCFVIGERIETIAELKYQIDQIENEPESRHRKIAEYFGNVPKQIADLHVRIDWRRKRKSPPKCLHCGSTEILAIPEDDEFLHPATGQQMKVTGRGFASTAVWQATFSPEGDRLNEPPGTRLRLASYR